MKWPWRYHQTIHPHVSLGRLAQRSPPQRTVGQMWRNAGQALQEPEFRRPVHQRAAQSLHVRMPCP